MKRILFLALAGAVLGGVRPAAIEAQTALCNTDFVNVRARASLSGEIVTRLKKGDSVFILEEITLKKPKADEPAKWARISFPTNAHVWVDGQYLNPTNKSVRVRKLNVRAGPGENYGVVGLLAQDETVTSLREKEGWLEIAAPTNAFAFVAMDLLVQQPGEAVANTNAPVAVAPPVIAAAPPVQAPTSASPAPPTIPTPAPTIPTPVAHDETATPPTPPAPDNKTVVSNTAPPVAPPQTAVVQPKPVPASPEPKRIVSREGKVHRALDLNAPTGFVLENTDTGLTMDYLYSVNPKIELKKYLGYRVIVTGDEGMDKHWPATPVLHVQTIEFP